MLANDSCSYSQEAIRDIIMRCVALLIKHDKHLLVENASERSITHRLGMYLTCEFTGWDVDCEYNKDRHDSKEVGLPPRSDISSEDVKDRCVFPDVIVHKRGLDKNLLSIEVKKTMSTYADGEEFDKLKLRKYRDQLGYQFGVFLELRTKCESPGVSKLEFI